MDSNLKNELTFLRYQISFSRISSISLLTSQNKTFVLGLNHLLKSVGYFSIKDKLKRVGP